MKPQPIVPPAFTPTPDDYVRQERLIEQLLQRIEAVEQRIGQLTHDANDPVKHNIRIGGSR